MHRLARSAACLGALLALAPLRASAQCDGEIAIDGDATLAAEQRATLRARSSDHCGPRADATVEVTATSVGVHVLLRGPGASSAVRDVEQIATAALLVESWSEASALDLLEPPRSEPHVAAPEPAPEPVPEPAPEAHASDVVLITADGVASFGNEGSSWFGAQVGACAHAGPTCIGGAIRYLTDSNLSDGTPAEGGQRTFLSAEAELSLPTHPTPEFTLAPALALGVGWLDVVVIDGMRSVSTQAFRALVVGSVAGAVAIVDWLALELRLAITWSPLARQAIWYLDGLAVDADPVVSGAALLGVRVEIR